MEGSIRFINYKKLQTKILLIPLKNERIRNIMRKLWLWNAKWTERHQLEKMLWILGRK